MHLNYFCFKILDNNINFYYAFSTVYCTKSQESPILNIKDYQNEIMLISINKMNNCRQKIYKIKIFTHNLDELKNIYYLNFCVFFTFVNYISISNFKKQITLY